MHTAHLDTRKCDHLDFSRVLALSFTAHLTIQWKSPLTRIKSPFEPKPRQLSTLPPNASDPSAPPVDPLPFPFPPPFETGGRQGGCPHPRPLRPPPGGGRGTAAAPEGRRGPAPGVRGNPAPQAEGRSVPPSVFRSRCIFRFSLLTVHSRERSGEGSCRGIAPASRVRSRTGHPRSSYLRRYHPRSEFRTPPTGGCQGSAAPNLLTHGRGGGVGIRRTSVSGPPCHWCHPQGGPPAHRSGPRGHHQCCPPRHRLGRGVEPAAEFQQPLKALLLGMQQVFCAAYKSGGWAEPSSPCFEPEPDAATGAWLSFQPLPKSWKLQAAPPPRPSSRPSVRPWGKEGGVEPNGGC